VGKYKEELERFKAAVKERGHELRKLSLFELEQVGDQPTEHFSVGARTATIDIIVEQPSYPNQEARRVVVQGFLKHRFLPGKSVCLDGFYKYPDGSIVPMIRKELWDYD
jgi:hypothetical protein